MAQIKLKGMPINTNGMLPANGSKAPNFVLTAGDLTDHMLSQYKGKVLLNIYPSIDTLCNSVRKFNVAAALDNTVVLGISEIYLSLWDVSAVQRYRQGIYIVRNTKTDFGKTYGLKLPMALWQGYWPRQ